MLSPTKSCEDVPMSSVGDEKTKSKRSSSLDSSASLSSEDSIIETAPITEYRELAEPEEVLSKHPSYVHGVDLSKHVTGISVATNATQDPGFEIDFADDDKGDPRNWSLLHRALIIFSISFSTLTV